MNEFNVTESIKGQKEYCEREDAPHFAPFSGNCWNCNMNIYEPRHWKYEMGRRRLTSKEESTITTGITTKEAKETLVTGCPHCNRSYCD